MVSAKELERNVPELLKSLRRWVAWGPDPDSARPKCPLLVTARGRRASTRKSDTWVDWRLAKVCYERHSDADHGIGFVFTEEDGLVYVDVDDCVDAKGNVRDWARPYVQPFAGKAYIELSPSGKGLHIVGKGRLPEAAGCGGKVNFPEHATGTKVPEVAIFSHGKYTTITGRVFKKQGKLGDVTSAVAEVWALAGLRAIGVDAHAGPAPEQTHLVEVDPRRAPPAVRKELKDCTAGDAEDRSAARFALYAEASKRLDPEEIFALVVQSDWYEASGAAEKGWEHTWSDVVRACAKVAAENGDFTAYEEREAAEVDKAVTSWKDIGVPVTVRVTKEGPVHEAVYGVQSMKVVLTKHPTWKGRIRRNEFTQGVDLDGVPMGESVSDVAEALRSYLRWDREPQLELVRAAIGEAAEVQKYNPVADWLRGLKWDGKLRSYDWLVRAGCEDCAVTRTVGRKFLLALVARALRPGCKLDTVLILEGPQGKKKSMLLEALVGREYFTESPAAFERDDKMVMHRNWVVELSELSAFKKAEQETIKKFVASPEDSFRAPYAREVHRYPRQFVLVGTTNDDEYLSDATGNRRYWPVRLTNLLDPELVKGEREQLMAEAVVALEAGEPWWFDEQPAELVEAQEDRMVTDPLTSKVEAWLGGNVGQEFPLGDIMGVLGLPADRRDLQMRVVAVLKRLGYSRVKRRTPGGGTHWVWRDPLFQSEGGEVLPFPPSGSCG